MLGRRKKIEIEDKTPEITKLILDAKAKAQKETGVMEVLPPKRIKWPREGTVGPGLEGAVACETRIGFVNGSKGQLIYRGYDIYDLCAYSTYEEVSYLLLHGSLPTQAQLAGFSNQLKETRHLPRTLREVMSMPVENMHPMAALRIAASTLRRSLTWRDEDGARPSYEDAIAADEDSIAMETEPMGEKRATYEFRKRKQSRPAQASPSRDDAVSLHSCKHVISGMATLVAAISRIREGKLPIEPDPELGHAANFLYMMTGRRPTAEEERVMDVTLILHADHGMNPSTFSTMVVASTMSDIYFSIGAGIAALNGPLHGGANEAVIRMLDEIGAVKNVPGWYERQRKQKRKIPGFGHRVYKAYDPRARILGPLAKYLCSGNKEALPKLRTAKALERLVIKTLGSEKGIFPNVDFYSGLVYESMGIAPEMFTPIFAVSRVAGWTARVREYLVNNRIFRPRAWYIGEFDKEYVPLDARKGKS